MPGPVRTAVGNSKPDEVTGCCIVGGGSPAGNRSQAAALGARSPVAPTREPPVLCSEAALCS